MFSKNPCDKIYVLILTTFSLTACAASGDGRVTSSEVTSGSPYYIDYYLPEREFKIDATYQLRECDTKSRSLTVKVGTEISPTITTDLDEKYRFSPQLITDNSRFDDQNIVVSLHPNGTIKALNGSGENKTGSILGNAFKFVANILKFAFTGAADANVVQDKNEQFAVCNLATQRNIQSANEIERRIKELKQDRISLLKAAQPTKANAEQITYFAELIKQLSDDLTDLRMNQLTFKHTFTLKADEIVTKNRLLLPIKSFDDWLSLEKDKELIDGIKDVSKKVCPVVGIDGPLLTRWLGESFDDCSVDSVKDVKSHLNKSHNERSKHDNIALSKTGLELYLPLKLSDTQKHLFESYKPAISATYIDELNLSDSHLKETIGPILETGPEDMVQLLIQQTAAFNVWANSQLAAQEDETLRKLLEKLKQGDKEKIAEFVEANHKTLTPLVVTHRTALADWLKKQLQLEPNTGNSHTLVANLFNYPSSSDKALKTMLAMHLDRFKHQYDKIVIRRPLSVSFMLCKESCPAGEALQQGTVTMPQWGTAELIDFKLKKFEKRTLAMEFDESGQPMSLTWVHASRVDNALAGLAGASEQAVAFAQAAKYGRETAENLALEQKIKVLTQRVSYKTAQEAFDKAFSTDTEVSDGNP